RASARARAAPGRRFPGAARRGPPRRRTRRRTRRGPRGSRSWQGSWGLPQRSRNKDNGRPGRVSGRGRDPSRPRVRIVAEPRDARFAGCDGPHARHALLRARPGVACRLPDTTSCDRNGSTAPDFGGGRPRESGRAGPRASPGAAPCGEPAGSPCSRPVPREERARPGGHAPGAGRTWKRRTRTMSTARQEQRRRGAVEIPLQAASRDIWDKKYRLKTKHGEPVDASVDDTWQRVARSLADVEATPELRAHWYERFLWALRRGA